MLGSVSGAAQAAGFEIGDVLLEIDGADVRGKSLAEVNKQLGAVKKKKDEHPESWHGVVLAVEREAATFPDGDLDLDDLDGVYEAHMEEELLGGGVEAEPMTPKKKALTVLFDEDSKEYPKLGMTFHVHLSARTGELTIELNAPTPGMLASQKDIRENDTLVGVNKMMVAEELREITDKVLTGVSLP